MAGLRNLGDVPFIGRQSYASLRQRQAFNHTLVFGSPKSSPALSWRKEGQNDPRASATRLSKRGTGEVGGRTGDCFSGSDSC
jgi:hypothetical protein